MSPVPGFAVSVHPLQLRTSSQSRLCLQRRVAHQQLAPRRIPVRCAESKSGGPPAGVLLAVSSVLAISTVGCIFELTGGNPQYGVPVTSGILLLSGPGFIALFVAAIRKGQLESQED